jgi:hypothetical protein
VAGHRAEQLTAEARYEPSRGSAAIGQAASAVRGITSLFTVALLADSAWRVREAFPARAAALCPPG